MSHGVLRCHGCCHDHRAQGDRSVRAIVITGAGSRPSPRWRRPTGNRQRPSPPTIPEPHGHLAQVTLRVAKASTVPLIARVGGACVAGMAWA